MFGDFCLTISVNPIGGMIMDMRIEASDLTGIGLTKQEIQDVLSSTSSVEQIRLLRQGRGRILEDLHDKQQALDKVDYFIHQLRQLGT